MSVWTSSSNASFTRASSRDFSDPQSVACQSLATVSLRVRRPARFVKVVADTFYGAGAALQYVGLL